MENKLTAVEWLEDELSKLYYDTQFKTFEEFCSKEVILWEQAKAMEKEQIINARIDGDENHTFNCQMREEYANDYYNETYGK